MDLTVITSRYNFYQQVRTLLHKFRDGKLSAAEILDTKLHFKSTLSLDAPNGQIDKIEYDDLEGTLSITVCQNGLTGAMGALPTAYSEWMLERHYRYSDQCAKAFLDMFGHRLYCLDYLSWQKNHLYASAESGSLQSLHQAVLALSGLSNTTSVLGEKNYVHLFSSPVRSLANLEVWLSHYYSVPARVTPFTGDWKTVDKSEQCQLGNPGLLLETAPMIGHVRREVDSCFDITLGPMEEDRARYFLPEGNFLDDLCSRIHGFLGSGLNFRLYLSLTCHNCELLPLGAGQLGLDACIGLRAASRLLQVSVPSHPEYISM